MQQIITAIISICLFLNVIVPPTFGLNDGQMLVIEAWNQVNQGYIEPKRFEEIQWRRLRQRALEKPITNSKQAYSAIEAMLMPLSDPYTRLIKPTDFQAMKLSNFGSELNGVGIQLGARSEDGEIVVISALEGSPAEDAGIGSGSILVKVNGESPKKLGLEATASRLRGEIGSQVVIEIQDPNEESKELTIERRTIDLRPVRTKRLRNESHTLGYLRITQFSEGVPAQVKEAIEELSEKEVEGIILDLRNNSGGLVSSGLAVANALISDKPIVETKNREGISDPIRASELTLYDGPMVTLVNKGTASASEILAGALQDNNRSELIGRKTFGKGLIQSLSNLSDGSGLAITVASYLTPEGRDIQNVGLDPNRILELPEPLNPGGDNDRWIKDAENYLSAIIERGKDNSSGIIEPSQEAKEDLIITK